MRLSKIEFIAMNNPFRRFIQKHVEFQNFRKMGLAVTGKDLLEVGCGSGYGAALLSRLGPRSYAGIDLMPEQIALAKKRNLAGYEFMEMDAADMKVFRDSSKDEIVVFGILHHIPAWRRVLGECRRVLKPGGSLFIEEPDGNIVRKFDSFMRWEHPEDALFTLAELEKGIVDCGFSIKSKKKMIGFGIYCAQKTVQAES